MPAILALIPVRYWIYGAAAIAIVLGLVAVRAHYVNQGWDKALEAVKAQDTNAKEAASKAQLTVDRCYAAGGVWSTISGNCTLGAKP